MKVYIVMRESNRYNREILGVFEEESKAKQGLERLFEVCETTTDEIPTWNNTLMFSTDMGDRYYYEEYGVE